MDRDALAVHVPNSVTVCGPDMEDIVSWRQSRIRGESSPPHIVPILFQPLHSIGIAVLTGGKEMEGGELKGDDLVGVGEVQAVGIRDRPRQESAFVGERPDRDILIEQLKRDDGDFGRRFVIPDVVRMKNVEPVAAAEEKFAAAALEIGPPVEFIPLQAVGPGKGTDASADGVEAGQPFVRAEPEQARFVFEDPINDVVGKPGV